MKINQILISLCLMAALVFGIFAIGTQQQKYETAVMEKQIMEHQKALKVSEIKLKQQQVHNERLRTDIETVRLQAFIKAYSRGDYIVEGK